MSTVTSRGCVVGLLAAVLGLAPTAALAGGRFGRGSFHAAFTSGSDFRGAGYRGGGYAAGGSRGGGHRGGGYRGGVYRGGYVSVPSPTYREYGWSSGYRAPALSVSLSPGWGGGRWFHGSHGGRLGWWWGVNNFWYRYDAPVYPYPTVTSTVVVPVEQSVAYFCRSAWAYYPQVSDCPEAWESVPR